MKINNPKCMQCKSFSDKVRFINDVRHDPECTGYASAEHPSCFIKKRDRNEKKKLEYKLIFAWYDFWIGLYYDRKQKAIYISLLPMVILKLSITELWLYEFRCSKHGKWFKWLRYARGIDYCLECQNETKRYNAMLVREKLNWPRALHGHIAAMRIAEKQGVVPPGTACKVEIGYMIEKNKAKRRVKMRDF